MIGKGNTLKIHPKVGGGSFGALVATILLWGLGTYGGVQPPPEVATAISGVMAFLGSYLVSGDQYQASEPKPASPPPELGRGLGPSTAMDLEEAYTR
jgi:hypothetical protein